MTQTLAYQPLTPASDERDGQLYRRYWTPIWIRAMAEEEYKRARLPAQAIEVLKALLDLSRQTNSREIHATVLQIGRLAGVSKSAVARQLQYFDSIGLVTLVEKLSVRQITLHRPFETLKLDKFQPIAQAILTELYARADAKRVALVTIDDLANAIGQNPGPIRRAIWILSKTDTLTDRAKPQTNMYRLEVSRRPGPHLMLELLPADGDRKPLAPFYDE